MTLDELIAAAGAEPGSAVLTPDEAGRVLKCSGRTVHRYAAAGEVPSIRLGRRLLIPAPRLLEMVSPPPNGNGPVLQDEAAEHGHHTSAASSLHRHGDSSAEPSRDD